MDKIRVIVPAHYGFINGHQPSVLVAKLIANDRFTCLDETKVTSYLYPTCCCLF